ncbi:MAG: hypothetical protein LBM77_12655, partial [Spirochaetaceae bacterium]|nr:hypothetical protein [Spirochaetaceae bacterium]
DYKIEGISENDQGLIYGNKLFTTRSSIDSLAAGGENVFFIDSVAGWVYRYAVGDDRVGAGRALPLQTATAVFRIPSSAYHIAVNAEGNKALVSSYRSVGTSSIGIASLSTAIVTEYASHNGKPDGRWRETGRRYEHLFNGTYFKDGVVGIGKEANYTNITYIAGDGTKEILQTGNNKLIFANPVAIDDSRIAFIAADKGIKGLYILNYNTKNVEKIMLSGEDKGILSSIRGLSYAEGKLYFSYNDNERLYKLATLDINTMQLSLYNEDISGQVFNPIALNGEVYYKAAFSHSDTVMRYPHGGGARPSGRAVVANATTVGAGRALPRQTRPAGPASTYNPFKYANPLQFWLPYPLVRQDRENALGHAVDGLNLLTVFNDPTDTNRALVTLGFDINHLMAPFNVQWVNEWFGFPLQIQITDDIDKYSSAEHYIRFSGLTLSGSLSPALGSGIWRLNTSLGGAIRFDAYQERSEAKQFASAYTWPYHGFAAAVSIGLGFSNRFAYIGNINMFGKGISFNTWTRYGIFKGLKEGNGYPSTFPSIPRFEGLFIASGKLGIPLRTAFFGAYDKMGMTVDGYSIVSGGNSLYSAANFANYAPVEYGPTGNNTGYYAGFKWLAGNETAIGVFSWEIQDNIAFLYFERLTGSLGWRGSLVDFSEDGSDLRLFHSVIGRLATKVEGMLDMELSFALKINELEALRKNESLGNNWWYIGFKYSLSL